MKKIDKVLDLATGKETIIEREETAEEKTQREALEAEVIAIENYKKLKASAKAKLIAGEPLTADEADTLVI